MAVELHSAIDTLAKRRDQLSHEIAVLQGGLPFAEERATELKSQIAERYIYGAPAAEHFVEYYRHEKVIAWTAQWIAEREKELASVTSELQKLCRENDLPAPE